MCEWGCQQANKAVFVSVFVFVDIFVFLAVSVFLSAFVFEAKVCVSGGAANRQMNDKFINGHSSNGSY